MSTQIMGLGEIALRVSDLDSMQSFYRDVIGLELMRRFPHAAFFRIAEGFEGHTQILALFDRSGSAGYVEPIPARTTVDHLAFTISLADYESENVRLERAGLSVRTAVHNWIQWRSIYVDDPDGNTVELVCFDPSIPRD